jgi:hypothetical protein
MSDPVLVVAWLVLAHLAADFVLQNDWIAINKGTGGRTGWSALGVHGFHVGLCLVPFLFAYGLPAVLYIAVVVTTHILVDRWKVQTTRRAERRALEAARTRLADPGPLPASGLGSAWTPWPGMLYIADQVLHITIALVGWLVILEGVTLQQGFVDVVNTALRGWDRAVVHAAMLTGVVLVSLFIINTRAAFYFVLALVSPRELPEPVPQPAPGSASASTQPAASGYTLRVGPLVATVEPGVHASEPGEDDAAIAGTAPASGSVEPRPTPAVPTGAPARIGATIGALERLLIVAFVLVNAEAAVGFVIAAKTIARFKQLDDRGFAEYYLLGTLASVSVALLSAIVAKAALGTIP